MAHFALLDADAKVLDVLVVQNSDIQDLPFPESESAGVAYLTAIYGADTVWKQTSYSGSFRKNFACTGGSYSAEYDAFIYVKPFLDWVLSPQTCQWEAPAPYPADGQIYYWNAQSGAWDLLPDTQQKGRT
jgi:hypothetical protein